MRTKESETLARQILNKHKLYSDDGSKGYHTDSSIVDAMFEFTSTVKNPWVSVEERLPEKGQLVLCRWHPDACMAPDKEYSLIELVDKDGFRFGAVTHWQEITPPGI